MKINYSNKLNAYQTVAAVLAEYQATWQALPALVVAATALNANIAEIQTLAQAQARRAGVAN